MGKALSDSFPESRQVFQEADEALGSSLSKACFDGTESELALTETTQPAILTVSVAALRALEGQGVRAIAAAGHSLGEYSAHVAAGTIRFSDAVRTVRLRGRFMQEAVPVGEGAMAAILGLGLEAIDQICRQVRQDQVVSPANLNAPGQIVIAGHAAAVDRAVEACRAEGARRAIPLQVSAPFHCPLMDPAATRLAGVLEEITLRAPRFPVYANVDASPIREGEAAREALVRQVSSPVRWQEVVEAMAADGIDTMIELGPGRVLAGMVKKIRRDIKVFSVSDPDGVETVANALGDRS
jgi:[acyl-carrier-protein] S-malonyltransferase